MDIPSLSITMHQSKRHQEVGLSVMKMAMESMQSDIKSMQREQKETNQRLERVENKTDKNTLMLEDITEKRIQLQRFIHLLENN